MSESIAKSAEDLRCPEIRCGPWQKVLTDITDVDLLLCDPPYSQRTHKGQRSNVTRAPSISDDAQISFEHVAKQDITSMVSYWLRRTSRWIVMFGDHHTVGWALEAVDHCGWYGFPPIPWTKTGAIPRLRADGPDSSVEYLCIARRRGKVPARHRPGYYHGLRANGEESRMVGSKPVWLMRALIRDYSEPGDLVCDPFAGFGTTLLAAAIEGRRAVGCEVNAKRREDAKLRIAGGYTPALL